MKRLRNLIAMLLFFLVHSEVQAQIGFESLLANINDVSVFFSCWQTRGDIAQKGDCPRKQNGYGIEVSYSVAKIPLRKPKRQKAALLSDSVWITIRCGPVKCDTTEARNRTNESPLYAVSTIAIECGSSVCDTTTTLTPQKPAMDTTEYVSFELGLGYSQFSGFESADSTFELRGTVREVPGISLYATYGTTESGLFRYVSPYVGLQSGLLMLNNVSIYDHDSDDAGKLTTYNATGTVFQAGLVTGLQLGLGNRARIFLEKNFTHRKFPNVQWSGGALRPEFPRELDFSGSGWTLGLQMGTRSPK